jgi:hypothetical protein
MAMGPHDRLINQAAREELRPLGLRQKGRSRTWIDDHGWWLGVVVFRPSAWAKGSGLDVGVTWLWHFWYPPEQAFLFTDLMGWSGHNFEEYDSDEQFEPHVRRLAVQGAERVIDLRRRLQSVSSAGDALATQAAGRVGWPVWEAAVALGLDGRLEVAQSMFAEVAASDDDRGWWQPVKRQAAFWRDLLEEDHGQFCHEVRQLIERNREALRLPCQHSSTG